MGPVMPGNQQGLGSPFPFQFASERAFPSLVWSCHDLFAWLVQPGQRYSTTITTVSPYMIRFSAFGTLQ